MVHFQDLSNTGNGNWLVNATSGFFQMPVSTEKAALANQITDFHPENLCVHAGDVVDINTEGTGRLEEWRPDGKSSALT